MKCYQPENTLSRFYTKDEIELAKNANLIEIMQKLGLRLRECGGKEYCLEEHDSLKISHNMWCWNSRGKIGGNVIDFLMMYPDYNLSFPVAVGTILELTGRSNFGVFELTPEYNAKPKKKNTVMILPDANKTNNRAIAYLNRTRGIDYQLIMEMIKKKKIYEDCMNHNVIFVGYDKNGTPRYGFKRGTATEGARFAGDVEGSDKSHGFLIKGKPWSDTVYVFESPIDVLSYTTINIIKKESCDNHLLSLGCVDEGALDRFLTDNPQIKKIVICTDNDKAGRSCGKRIFNKYFKTHLIKSMYPNNKDYNDDLTELRKNLSVMPLEL